jgi:hypothetical protein
MVHYKMATSFDSFSKEHRRISPLGDAVRDHRRRGQVVHHSTKLAVPEGACMKAACVRGQPACAQDQDLRDALQQVEAWWGRLTYLL